MALVRLAPANWAAERSRPLRSLLPRSIASVACFARHSFQAALPSLSTASCLAIAIAPPWAGGQLNRPALHITNDKSRVGLAVPSCFHFALLLLLAYPLRRLRDGASRLAS